MFKNLKLSVTYNNIFSRLIGPNKLFKFCFCTNQNLETGNHYIFIKPTTTLKELKYKEEILEYFAYNYSTLNQSELQSILNKLKDYKILAPEIKEIKCFLRDFLEISENIKDEELIHEFINFFIQKIDEIDENIKENYINTKIENNVFDLDFTSLMNSFFFFLEKNIPNARSPKLFDDFFKCLNRFPSDNIEKLNDICKKLIEAYYTNEEVHLNKTDVFYSCRILTFLLKAFSEERIREIKRIKYLLNNFSIKLYDLVENGEKEENKNFIPKKNLEDFRILFYYMNIISNKNQSLNSVKHELKILSCEMKDKIFDSEDEITKFFNFFKEKLEEEKRGEKEENI
jgi:hypothetical protein